MSAKDLKQIKSRVKALPMPELLALYNTLTGKATKKFRSREVGEAQVVKALQDQATKLPKETPKPDANAAVASDSGASRVVSNMAGKKGRPEIDYKIGLGTPDTKLHKGSLRAQVIEEMQDMMKKSGKDYVQVSALVAEFGPKAKGAISKLAKTHWVKRIDE